MAKLFNLLAPDSAVFGEKDFQQLAIIRRMVRDLNFPVEVITVATVREPDGLALSSRNQYLSASERTQATVLYQALHHARELAVGGDTSAARLISAATEVITAVRNTRIDYVSIVDADTLQPLDAVNTNAVMLLALFIGKTRLIDNMHLLPPALKGGAQ